MVEKQYRYIIKDNQIHIWSENLKLYAPTNDYTTLIDSYHETEDENKKLKKENKELQEEFEQGLTVMEDIANAKYQHLKLKIKEFIEKETIKTEEYNHTDTATYYARKQLIQDMENELSN